MASLRSRRVKYILYSATNIRSVALIVEASLQHVDHVHFHVIPKNTAEDGLVIDIEGRWPAPQAPKEELDRILEEMKRRL